MTTRQVRDALTSRLGTVTGVTTVMPWPGDTQALPAPCITITQPRHRVDADFTVCHALWRRTWTVRIHVHQTNDQTATLVIDDVVDEVITALLTDRSLGGTVTGLVIDDVTTPDHPAKGAGAPTMVAALTVTTESRQAI